MITRGGLIGRPSPKISPFLPCSFPGMQGCDPKLDAQAEEAEALAFETQRTLAEARKSVNDARNNNKFFQSGRDVGQKSGNGKGAMVK